jgi:transcriptional regulator with PAS, ATPase and Fis domain
MAVDLSGNSVACNRNVVVKKTIEAISSDISKAFLKYPWPGNVRELEHAMEYAFLKALKLPGTKQEQAGCGHGSRDPLTENQKIHPHRIYPLMLECRA